jgi:glycerol-1-phosphatase
VSDATTAFERYEQVRHRLPVARFAGLPRRVANLTQVAEHVDGFLLDAFGVLNVGETPIPGAVARMADLRRMGKKLCVLTNAASYTRSGVLAKYHRLGFDFSADEVVSSRDVAAGRINRIAPGATWAAIAAAGDDFHDIPARCYDAVDNPKWFDDADAILFLSTARWTTALQQHLTAALSRRPRPFVIANPDLVAPREGDLSSEPGLFAHAVLDSIPVMAHWFGKPFGDAFSDGLERLDLPPDRVAMVGDTLHTDTLGGAAAGCQTVLVTDHGLFRGYDEQSFINGSGIIPDWVIPTT